LFYIISGHCGRIRALGRDCCAERNISGSTTTDSNGNYSFSVPAGGSYTITP
jgi:hypothetical protein